MSTDSSSSKDRLSVGWLRRSISPSSKKSAPKSDSRPSTSNGFLSPSTRSRSNSDASRSAHSSKSGSQRPSFRGVVNRLRSSSSASSLSGKAQEGDINDIHDWFNGFRRYNQMVTTQTSTAQEYSAKDLARATKSLTKNCGGTLMHALPEGAFDFGLLWCPAGEISRRDSNEPEPSWSWTAFDGPVNFPFDPSTCPDLYTAPKTEGELLRSEVVQFNVGPSNALYTVRREKNGALRIKYPPYFHAPWGADASVDSNTLRFNASTISADGFTTEQLHYQDREIPCSQLLDDKEQHCGVVMDFEHVISEPSSIPGTYEFVALSRSLRRQEPATHNRRATNPTVHPMGTPIWDGERFVWDEVVADFDETVFEEGPWKMINVMLIKWVGEHAERIAIARIHEDAWLAKEPVRKDIVLR